MKRTIVGCRTCFDGRRRELLPCVDCGTVETRTDPFVKWTPPFVAAMEARR